MSTFAGIVMELRLLQCINASPWISRSVEGRLMLVMLIILKKVRPPMIVTPSETTTLRTSLSIPADSKTLDV